VTAGRDVTISAVDGATTLCFSMAETRFARRVAGFIFTLTGARGEGVGEEFSDI
jgi:hypothetical protein